MARYPTIRRARRLLLTSLCAVLLTLVASPPEASAQSAGGARAAAAAETPPQAPLYRAEEIRRLGVATSRSVLLLLDGARRTRDPIQTRCLDDVLSQVHSELRGLDRRVQRLRDAIALSDPHRRNHEATVLEVLAMRFGELQTASRACVGDVATPTGRTTLTTTIDRTVPREDPTRYRDPGRATGPHIPPPASPGL